jgi:hypothetical protein
MKEPIVLEPMLKLIAQLIISRVLRAILSLLCKYPDFSCAREGVEDSVLFASDVGGSVLSPGEVPLGLSALSDRGAVHGRAQVGRNQAEARSSREQLPHT